MMSIEKVDDFEWKNNNELVFLNRSKGEDRFERFNLTTKKRDILFQVKDVKENRFRRALARSYVVGNFFVPSNDKIIFLYINRMLELSVKTKFIMYDMKSNTYKVIREFKKRSDDYAHLNWDWIEEW